MGIFWETLLSSRLEAGVIFVLSAANEHCRPLIHPAFSSQLQTHCMASWGRPVPKIPGSARYEHDKKRENPAAIPHQGTRSLSSRIWFSSPAEQRSKQNPSGEDTEHGEFVMELRVQLKICEGCGCLWYRAQTQGSVYCKECETKLKDFPSPESRKRRGRPSARRWSESGRWLKQPEAPNERRPAVADGLGRRQFTANMA